MRKPRLDRREMILGAGACGLATLPILAAACAQQRPAASGGGRLIAGDTCPLTPAQTEGPFYFDPRLARSDITEGKPGIPLLLRLQIVGAEDCAAFEGARVDIWHCDAAGQYSGYDSESTAGEMFLRGIQRADAKGVVSFATVFPGWYGGRATHIHCKAQAANGREVTTQFYFPDALAEAVHREAAYSARRSGGRMTNADDGIFRAAGSGEATMLQVARAATGYEAAIVVSLD